VQNRPLSKKEKKRKRIEAGIRIVRTILRMPTTPKDARGFRAEDKVEEALEYFKKKKIIAGFQRSERYSPDDRSGIDFIIKLLTGKILKIDVKNYRWFWAEEKKCQEEGIELLTIWEPDDEKTTREKVKNLILLTYLADLRIEKVREIVFAAIKEKMKPPRRNDKILSWLKRKVVS